MMKRLSAVTLAAATTLLAHSVACLAQEAKFFDAGGVRIRYVEQGQGEPLVFLHGNGGRIESLDTTPLLKKLTAKYKVIRYDARGHGESGKPYTAEAYGQEQALDTVRLMDHLGIKSAHIVGYSMGSNMTALLLTLKPERFKTATLIAGPGRLSMTADEEKEWEQEASEREKECVSRTQILRLAPRDEPPPTEEAILARSKACFADPVNDPKALGAYVRSRRYQVVDLKKAAAVTVPTLGIVGDQDGLMVGMKKLKEMRPNIPLVIVAGATHGGPRGILMSPQTESELLTFLDAHR